MAFFSDLFDSITNQQATPQQTIIPTTDLLNQGYNTATGMAPQVQALNAAYQPIITGNQLASENQVFGGAANQVQRGAYQSILDSLNLGSAIDPALQDQLTTNYLQGSSASGLGASNAARMFAADQGRMYGQNLLRQRQQDALGASGMLPSSSMTPQVQGIPNAMGIANAIQGEQSARDQFANIAENTRRENFSALINTGGRILGMVGGGIAGAFLGNPAMGVQAGGAIGGSLGGKTGVAGYGTAQQKSGGSDGGFSSILSGLNFGGGGSANSAGGGGGFGAGGFGSSGGFNLMAA